MRRATWLALAALLSMQLVLAGHQFDHTATSVAESCEFCVQLDRLDDGVVGHSSPAIIRHDSFVESSFAITAFVSSAAHRAYNSRAPPYI